MSYGITKEDFKNNAKLKDIINAIATAKSNKIEYVSVFQHKKYPIIGPTFHPEKIAFEQNFSDYVPDSFEAIKVSRLIGNSFTIYARTQNERTMTEQNMITLILMELILLSGLVLINIYIITKNKI